MELKLDSDEVENILLEWAAQKWPKAFNAVDGDSYRAIGGVTFSRDATLDAPSKEPT